MSTSVDPRETVSALELSALPTIGARFSQGQHWAEVYARARLPTRAGDFHIVVFRNSDDDKEHVALVRGVVQGFVDVPARVHSECFTGDVLTSLRCDCREQLEQTMVELGRAERGVLLYMRQEGRGIGLGNKIRAYALQEAGFDTYEANRHLGFDEDLRTYEIAALLFRALGVVSLRLATNNPRKLFGLRQAGVEITARVPVITQANPYNRTYLLTKAEKAGHLLSVSEPPEDER